MQKKQQSEARKLEIKEWFKSLSAEERVLCLTTIDKEVGDLISNTFCKRQKQNQWPSNAAHLSGLDKLQSLLFLMTRPQAKQWNFEVSEVTQDRSKKLQDELQTKKPFFSTLEANKKREPAKFAA